MQTDILANLPPAKQRAGAKLSLEQKDEIRALYATGRFRLIDLAVKYGVSIPLIGQIIDKNRPITKDEMIRGLRDAHVALADRAVDLQAAVDRLTARVEALEVLS